MSLRIATALLALTPILAQAQMTAIVGGTVHTVGPQGTLENATVLIDNGRIVAVGQDVAVGDDVVTIDASGKIVTPGLFTPASQLGLNEVSLSADPADAEQRGDRFTAGFDVADAFNRRSTLIAINRIEGVTRAVIMPKPAWPDEFGNMGHVLSGLAAIVNLGDAGDPVDRRSVALVVNLGESGAVLASGSRAAALLTLRDALDEAIAYRDDDDFERDDYTFSRRDLEALQGVLAGSVPIYAGLNRASDIEVLMALVREYGIRAVIDGGAEAWMLADELAAAGIPVVLLPMENLPSNFDRINARLESAAILAAAGVTVCFVDTRSESHNARNITQVAGNAVAHGLAWDEALRAITLSPAEVFGMAENVGSIEPGKDADLVIWPGDPLELVNYPEKVLIKGEDIPMISRQTLLRDRYLQDSRKPPAFRR